MENVRRDVKTYVEITVHVEQVVKVNKILIMFGKTIDNLYFPTSSFKYQRERCLECMIKSFL